MASELIQCDLVVLSFGMTAYESLCLGIPAIHLCLTEDHVESSKVFHNFEVSLSLGLFSQLSKNKFITEIEPILNQKDKYLHLKRNAMDISEKLRSNEIINTINEYVNTY